MSCSIKIETRLTASVLQTSNTHLPSSRGSARRWSVERVETPNYTSDNISVIINLFELETINM